MENLTSLLDQRLAPSHLSLLLRASQLTTRRDLRLYLVGGAVRDLLLADELVHPELDLSIAGGGIREIEELAGDLGGRVVLRSQFGTARIIVEGVTIDVAMARRETYAQPGALPAVSPGTLREDLQRRDFSVNAMAIDLSSSESWGDLHDHFGGQDDLRNGYLRTLHTLSFSDDPTRVFRAVRYASRLALEIEPATLAQLKRDLHHVDALSGDRVRHELERIFGEERPSSSLRLAGQLGVLAVVHPELGPPRSLEAAAQLDGHRGPERDLGLIACLAFDATPAGRAELVERLHMNGMWTRAVSDTPRVRECQAELGAPGMRPGRAYSLLWDLEPASIMAGALLSADAGARRWMSLYLDKLRHVRPLLDGHDLIRLGVPEGPLVGELLEELQTARLEGLLETRHDEENLIAEALNRGKSSRG